MVETFPLPQIRVINLGAKPKPKYLKWSLPWDKVKDYATEATFNAEIGKFAESANATTRNITLTTAAAVGELIVLGVGFVSASATISVSDSGTNTWTAGSSVNTSNPALGYKTQVFWTIVTNSLAIGATITIATTSTRGAGIAVTFGGAVGTSATVLDVGTTTASAATGVAVAIGPTATTAGASIVVGVSAYSAVGTVTPTNGYSTSTTNQVLTNTNMCLTLVYKLTTSAAAETATMTLPATSGWQGVIEAFKSSAVAPPRKSINVFTQAVMRAVSR